MKSKYMVQVIANSNQVIVQLIDLKKFYNQEPNDSTSLQPNRDFKFRGRRIMNTGDIDYYRISTKEANRLLKNCTVIK